MDPFHGRVEWVWTKPAAEPSILSISGNLSQHYFQFSPLIHSSNSTVSLQIPLSFSDCFKPASILTQFWTHALQITHKIKSFLYIYSFIFYFLYLEDMELKGNFLPQFKVRETRFGLHPSTKHEALLVVAIFTGYFSFSKLLFMCISQYHIYGGGEIHSHGLDRLFMCLCVCVCFVLNCQYNRKSCKFTFVEFVVIGLALSMWLFPRLILVVFFWSLVR